MVLGPVGVDQVEGAAAQVSPETEEGGRCIPPVRAEVEDVEDLQSPFAGGFEDRAAGESADDHPVSASGHPGGQLDGILRAGVVPADGDQLEESERLAHFFRCGRGGRGVVGNPEL
jgi:hypothetical protein